jgi:hypothetical protein
MIWKNRKLFMECYIKQKNISKFKLKNIQIKIEK